MAIDDIEYNELSSLSGSRLGNKNFINDDDGFLYLSKREKKKRTQQARFTIETFWAIDPQFIDDCEYLTMRLAQLQNAIESELGKNPSKRIRERIMPPYRDMEAKYKNEIVRLNCSEKKRKEEKEEEKKSTIDTISKITSTTSDLPKAPITEDGDDADDSKDGKSNVTKYVIYGVGGLFLVLSLVLLLKPTNTQ